MQQNPFSRRAWLRGAAGSCLALPLGAGWLGSAMAQAAAYPSRAVKAVVPYPAGGMSDVSSRAVLERLSRELGQPVIIENKAGAASTLASNWFASQAADGYTLYAAPVSIVINPLLQKSVGYEARRDFVPISMMIKSPFVLQANPQLNVSNMKELLTLLRANPDKYAIGSSGPGSINHLAAEYFMRAMNVKMQVVHYRGGAPAAQDLMGGVIQLMFSAANEAAPLIRAGRTRGIAVTTRQRLPILPELPTVEEAAGVEGFEAVFWLALMAPAKTPEDVLARLRSGMQAVGQDKALRDKLEGLGVQLQTSTTAQVLAAMDRDEALWSRIIREQGIKE
ncbi:Tripartite-type tricarboxylate transporter, receptor component TctC [Oryzisolibacter propanilivorax]|uniref:Tripartite-type tricarboxylate transporter, receptor component TctC n=1 Tax=Oryzisolibacter propanilivorax TaxID=1527607 RepID=A0A1G9QGZ5_9BURK|nr:tripartite tricarboxylate transporter substrate binding protein [Oryzisolibacter propanilivorax]SDM10332.1 Tripartite-type tricarboxylate transporter, receptor component TctC [Oryzisolibacter propanilivorax]